MPNGNDIKCVIRDTNETGVRVVLEGALVLPPEVMIMVSNFGRAKRARVVWQKELEAGLQFI